MKISKMQTLNKPETIELTFDQLPDFIFNTNWSPSVFNGLRQKKNFLQTDLLVLDIDSGCSIETAKTTFKDYQHIIATTRNHQKEKNGIITDRFRVIIPFSSTINTRSTYERTWQKAAELWPYIDLACKDTARLYYPCVELYSINSGSQFDAVLLEPRSKKIIKDIDSDLYGFIPSSYKYVQMFGVPAGQRNITIFRLSCDFFRCGYSEDEVFDYMTKITDLDEIEIANTVKSAGRIVLGN